MGMARRKPVGPDGLIYERYSGRKNRRGGQVGKAKVRARDPMTGRFASSDVARSETQRVTHKEPKVALRVRERGKGWRNWKQGDTRRLLQVAKFVGNKKEAVLSHDWKKRTKASLAMLDAGLTRKKKAKTEWLEFDGHGESISDCLENIDLGEIGYYGVYAWEIQCRVMDNGEDIKLFADGVEDFRPHYSREQIRVLWEKSEHVSHGLPDGETYQSVMKHNIAHRLRQAFSAREIRFSSLRVLERIKDPARWNHYPGGIVADALYDLWRAKDQVFDVRFSLRIRVIKRAKTTEIADFNRRLRNKKQKVG